ncbi:hypothetical protein ABZ897_48445 [Nonomuraea sp. NPDC046802]|uniref:hypothetical protein n=1 Tax=Nonomuraea sp. NPDC046802 TaxID=3154919 RepID=UPI0033FD105D
MQTFVRFATAVVVAAALTGGVPAAQASARRSVTQLSCAVTIPQSRPLTFQPPVTLRPRAITARGTLVLSSCSSALRTLARVRGGVARVYGRATASCNGVRDLRVRTTVTWYDSRRQTVGTSTVALAADTVARFNPGDALMGGRVTSGLLAGARVYGSTTPTGPTVSCALHGVRSIHGTGKVWARR